MCQAHGTECIFPQANGNIRGTDTDPARRLAAKTSNSQPIRSQPFSFTPTQHSNHQEQSQPAASSNVGFIDREYHHVENNAVGEFSNTVGIVAEAGNNSSHIVSPAVAEDNEVLESYLSTIPNGRRRNLIQPNLTANRSLRPVLFNNVLRRPLGQSNQSLSAMKCEIIEKCLEHVSNDVVDLFFRYANICFPVVDEISFRNVYSTHKGHISPALLSNLYSNALIYWKNSPCLNSGRSPDVRYIWNQANEALHSELYLSPGISTVMAILLNVCGRPSTSIFGNGGMIGNAVALSNALGLNRDPSGWNISPLEKKFRVRIWWLVVVHDRWCSLAYGTPLQIHRAQYDVPFPTVDDICYPDSSHDHKASAEIFVALTTLTEVLAEYLVQVYKVSKNILYPPDASALDLEYVLHDWEDSLSDNIRRIVLRGTDLRVPGAANLRLAYLAVKLLLRRLQLNSDKTYTIAEDESSSLFYGQTQRVAEEILHLVQELDEDHCRGFWLPVNSFSLTSATTFLLRSGLQNRNSDINTPLKIAKNMIDSLWSHRRSYDWDIADDCLANCSDLVERITLNSAATENCSMPFNTMDTSFQEQLDLNQSILDELLIKFPELADTNGL